MTAISRTLGFVYIRVPRTASSTFTHYLNTTFPNLVSEQYRQHASAVEVRRNLEDWASLYSFGFIRNPWDWLVSMYNANLSEGAFGKEALPGGPVSTMRKANMEFDEWVKARETTCIDWLSDDNGIIVDDVRLFEDFVPNARVKFGGFGRPPYKDWYTGDLAEYVADKCSREIEIGNYRF